MMWLLKSCDFFSKIPFLCHFKKSIFFVTLWSFQRWLILDTSVSSCSRCSCSNWCVVYVVLCYIDASLICSCYTHLLRLFPVPAILFHLLFLILVLMLLLQFLFLSHVPDDSLLILRSCSCFCLDVPLDSILFLRSCFYLDVPEICFCKTLLRRLLRFSVIFFYLLLLILILMFQLLFLFLSSMVSCFLLSSWRCT